MEVPVVQYDQGHQLVLNLVLAAMMLGVALDIQPRDFRRVVEAPKAPLIAMPAQFVLLPFVTWAITMLLELPAGVELGMILVLCCPGGNLSNVMTHLAKGNAALSISMTALASTVSIFMLPFNFAFWSSVNPSTQALLQAIDVDPLEIFFSLLFVLAVPLLLGQLMVRYWPDFAARIHTLLRRLSFAALITFIVLGIYRNSEVLTGSGLQSLVVIVILHNGLAFGLGYLVARISGLESRDTRAVSIEVGMQNSSLALAVIFTRFDGEPGMAVVAALWGIWHIVAGLGIASYWALVEQRSEAPLARPGGQP